MKEAAHGAWFLRVGDEWYLSVIYPYFMSVDETALKLSHGDRGTEDEPSYQPQFWKLDECAPAILDLVVMDSCPGLTQCITSLSDLRNYVCANFPDYFVAKERGYKKLFRADWVERFFNQELPDWENWKQGIPATPPTDKFLTLEF